MSQKITCVQARYQITGKIRLETGLHIGGSDDFSPIGAVDSVIIRDSFSQEPMIPGSSLKGKMRSLLAAETTDSIVLPKIEEEPITLKRLFGTGGDDIIRARLQFFDIFMSAESVENLNQSDTDLYLTEIKFENTIMRSTAVANPRQMERVPRGAEFVFKLNYLAEDLTEITADLKTLSTGLYLLQLDYLGGGGSRGNGRISFHDLEIKLSRKNDAVKDLPDIKSLQEIINESFS